MDWELAMRRDEAAAMQFRGEGWYVGAFAEPDTLARTALIGAKVLTNESLATPFCLKLGPCPAPQRHSQGSQMQAFTAHSACKQLCSHRQTNSSKSILLYVFLPSSGSRGKAGTSAAWLPMYSAL